MDPDSPLTSVEDGEGSWTEVSPRRKKLVPSSPDRPKKTVVDVSDAADAKDHKAASPAGSDHSAAETDSSSEEAWQLVVPRRARLV